MNNVSTGPEESSLKSSPFPALSKQTAGLINDVVTEVTSIFFTDKILLTISQGGRLGQWVEVNLNSIPSIHLGNAILCDNHPEKLPSIHLTPKIILGGGDESRETTGHLYAAQIANLIVTRDTTESRTVLLGLGFEKIEFERGTFFDMMELIQKVI